MEKMINRLLVIDMLVLFTGMILLFVRPFGLDMTWGIVMIAAGFIFSIQLFLVKLNITSHNE